MHVAFTTRAPGEDLMELIASEVCCAQSSTKPLWPLYLSPSLSLSLGIASSLYQPRSRTVRTDTRGIQERILSPNVNLLEACLPSNFRAFTRPLTRSYVNTMKRPNASSPLRRIHVCTLPVYVSIYVRSCWTEDGWKIPRVRNSVSRCWFQHSKQIGHWWHRIRNETRGGLLLLCFFFFLYEFFGLARAAVVWSFL